jgi:putative copper export protein
MLASALDSVRIFLHVLSATVWVGGQLTLAALVPVLRAVDPTLPKKAARAFNKVAWPAFGLLVLTGIWNVVRIPTDATTNYHTVLAIKITVVALSGVAAYLHSKAKGTPALAIWGALSGLSALGATYLGALLAG